MKYLVLILCLVCFATTARPQSNGEENPIVHVKQGQIKGKTLKSTHGRTFNAFLGIPYGKVEKRFTSPEPADAWNEIHDGTKDGPICKQYYLFTSPPKKVNGQEDCLVLNIYTPKLPNDTPTDPLPILVFIHGGGFVMGEGSSNVFGPELYMNKDIVLVLMNYRLGPFGFLSTGDVEAAGNFGLLDQVLALEWIRDNIEKFGGDPKRVTISGNSAGATSVEFHLLSPLSKGLFHNAIAQSGSAICPWSLQENPLNISQKIAEKVNCSTENTKVMVECLRQVDADELTKAGDLNEIPGAWSMSTVPVIENSINGKFLTECPLKMLSEGRFNKVPVISGVTIHETAMFVEGYLSSKPFKSPNDITDDEWKKFVRATADLGPGLPVLSNPKTIQAIRKKYFEGVTDATSDEFMERGIELSTDSNFGSCNDKMVKLLASAGAPVYMYVWDYAPQNFSDLIIGGKPAAFHGIDLVYLFNCTAAFLVNYTIDDDVQAFSDRILDLWINFTYNSNPTLSGKPVEWTPTPAGTIRYLNITQDMKMEDGYLTNSMKFWEDILYPNSTIASDCK